MRKKDLNKKLLANIILIIVISLVTNVVAETLVNSKDVYYEDNSGLGFNNVQDAIDATCIKFSDKLDSFKSEALKEMYPVGSIYISTSLDTKEKVGEALGGTWQVYGAGRTLIGAGTGNDGKTSKTFKIGESSGEYNHTLTESEMPSHMHRGLDVNGTVVAPWNSGNTGTLAAFDIGSLYVGNLNVVNSVKTGTTGGSQPHNNLQPYITAYMYQRTA